MGVTGLSGPISGSTGMTGPITGMKGMTGATGMTGAPPPSCVVCYQFHPNLFEVDLNLSTRPMSSVNIHLICNRCINITRKLLKNVKKQPLIEIPLLINHENIFIRHYAVKRLKEGK